MSEIRYYTDEHVAKTIINGLRQRDINVLSAFDVGLLGVEDDVHLNFALDEGRVIFTRDADFLRLAATGEAHAGIVYAVQGTSVSAIVRGLILIHGVLEAEEMVGRLEYL